jgi:hypothetical protein
VRRFEGNCVGLRGRLTLGGDDDGGRACCGGGGGVSESYSEPAKDSDFLEI